MCITLLTFLYPKYSYASETAKAKIGNNYYDTLEEAINAAGSTDVISLTTNVSLKKSLEIKKTVNIDLNNNTITAPEKVFFIEGGSLKLTGIGKVVESNPNYGAIILKGSDNPDKENYSTVSVGSGVTLEGWSGIFIDHNNKTGYGILVTMEGTINAIDDVNGGPGVGVYVNGNIKNQDNSPIINLTKTTKITSTGNGIYAAGYSTYNINGAYISGEESGLGIKSGVFNISDGTILGTGKDKTPTSGNNNGINPSGVAIQMESNSGYAGNIKLNIKGGTISSKHSNVIYEYIVGDSDTQVKSISLSGGKYTSDAGKPVFKLSDSFLNTHPKFITGGSYSSDPTSYLKTGYASSKNDGLFKVVSSTMGVFGLGGSNNSGFKTTSLISIVVIFGIITYLNRKKIFDFISSIKK